MDLSIEIRITSLKDLQRSEKKIKKYGNISRRIFSLKHLSVPLYEQNEKYLSGNLKIGTFPLEHLSCLK